MGRKIRRREVIESYHAADPGAGVRGLVISAAFLKLIARQGDVWQQS
jgi:hypothetical protein